AFEHGPTSPWPAPAPATPAARAGQGGAYPSRPGDAAGNGAYAGALPAARAPGAPSPAAPPQPAPRASRSLGTRGRSGSDGDAPAAMATGDGATTLGRPPEHRGRSAADPGGSPSPASESPLKNPMSAGPPALPVIVLVVVVAILILGVAWLVVAGGEAEPSASERQDDPSAADGDAGAPTGVTAEATAEGVRVSWNGTAGASYVVTILSATAPPQAMPPTAGTSALVPAAPAGATTDQRCFTVASAAASGAAGPASAPACLPGASPDTMLTAPATTAPAITAPATTASAAPAPAG
ncbi:MAG TPA: hypothetical protein VFI47_21565, partial [Acidimicrobiales bacterium]|nr:hypothetical protein [Acidimicrobiales bacterium]